MRGMEHLTCIGEIRKTGTDGWKTPLEKNYLRSMDIMRILGCV
jgi:hypothetical protein